MSTADVHRLRQSQASRAANRHVVTGGEAVDLTPTLPPFTVRDASRVLNVSADALYDAIARGEVRALRLGRLLRVSRAECARLLGVDSS